MTTFIFRRPILLAPALLFAVATVLYSVIWMFAVRHPFVDFGFWGSFSPERRSFAVVKVEPDSAAANEGLRAGDRIVAINGRALDTPAPFYDALIVGKPGDAVQFTIERPGAVGQITVREVIQLLQFKAQSAATAAQLLTGQVLGLYPLLFLVVGLPVLFLRVRDRNAWLLALLFGGFIVGAPLDEAWVPPLLRGFATGYKTILSGPAPAMFYFFFAVFPVSSPIDRRVPWLKWALLALTVVVSVPLGLACVLAGGSLPLYRLVFFMTDKGVDWLGVVYVLGSYGLGLVSLVWNSLRPTSVGVRRKTRVIVWGTVAGVLPIMVLGTFLGFAHKSLTDIPFWIYALVVTALLLVPLSFAYAVLKHRVLEIPVLVKRSARYLLVQRGFVLLTVALSLAATLIFAHSFSRLFRTQSDVALAAGLSAGVGLGVLLTWAGTETVKRGTQRIDRAFFRSTYDARQVLEHLAEKTRAATGRQEVDALLREEINRALHPKFMAVYLETGEGWLSTHQLQGVPPGLEKISARLPELAELARRGQVWEVPPEGKGGSRPLSVLAPLEPECLVPMLGRNSRLVGVLVLGPRLSEEPYSREDKRLLTSVASQTGIAVESIRLAEEMAERMEAERLAAQEMAIARQVQARLFPQKLPPLRTLEYAGACFQARQVGGDYYDFLDLGPGRLGFVLADVAGKGISGALLMANLQANLRSQYAVALEDLPRLLQSVNRLFYENTADSSYATLFFADYDDDARRFRYANCGHLPPLLLRSDGTVERLAATSTVLGLFEKWECLLAEVHMAPGDVLVVYTDGISEASNAHEEEFGEARLIESIRTSRQLPPPLLLDSLVAVVKAYSGVEQADDITLVVARAR